MASYVEFSLIEKLHARITEVSPANPGETLNDAVERLIAECDALRVQLDDREGDLAHEFKRANDAETERDALRTALQSVIGGWSEFDLEYNTGIDIIEARRIMDLAYNR